MKRAQDFTDTILTRRSFVASFATCVASIALLSLSGCSTPEIDTNRQTEASSNENSATGTNDTAAANSETANGTGGSRSLVLVFSRAGENYGVGDVEIGNTMVIAQMIAESAGADLFEIEPVNAYSHSYDETTQRAQEEKNSNARPEIKGTPDLSPYDLVFLGFPIWWGDAPMPLYSAIESLDWEGKIIAPFNTHAGSGDGGVFERLETVCPGSSVLNGLTISGVDAQNDRTQTQKEVDEWLASLPIG